VNWRPGTDKATLLARAALLHQIRAFFAQREVLEVETPLLTSSFGTEPSIEPLCSEYTGPTCAQGRKLYLQSSPEFAMKRLLAAGSGPIYQICKAFRNGEAGARHNPEFSLLEWYQPGFSAQALMDEVVDLMRVLLGQASLPIEQMSYADLFANKLNIDVFDSTIWQLQKSVAEHGITGTANLQLDKDGWFDLLMGHVLEPLLPKETLCFVHDYPRSQASLAKVNDHDPRTAARFELYYQGMELANGFVELTDVEEQSERFEHENGIRRSRGQKPMPIDQYLLEALEHGLPDTAGVALGLDRVLMAKLGLENIDQVVTFSLERA
jgi:lysyl-tRNA synthetase class 2